MNVFGLVGMSRAFGKAVRKIADRETAKLLYSPDDTSPIRYQEAFAQLSVNIAKEYSIPMESAWGYACLSIMNADMSPDRPCCDLTSLVVNLSKKKNFGAASLPVQAVLAC